MEAGIEEEDQIIALNGEPTPFFQDFFYKVVDHKNQEVEVSILRNEKDTMLFSLTTSETER